MEPRTDPRTHRRRSFIDDVNARAITELYLEDEDDGTDDDKPPPLDENTFEGTQHNNGEAGAAAAADGASACTTQDCDQDTEAQNHDQGERT